MSSNDRIRIRSEATWALLTAFLDRFAEDAPAEVKSFAASAVTELRVAGKDEAARLVESYVSTLSSLEPVPRSRPHS